MKTISLGVIACITWLVTGCSALDDDASVREDLGAAQQNVASSHHAPVQGSLALAAACGDGILDAGEQCDDGNTADRDGCSAACTLHAEAASGTWRIDNVTLLGTSFGP